MRINRQGGHMDMQLLPGLIGFILLIVVMGLPGNQEINLEKNIWMFVIFLIIATAVMFYGFAMHLYALGYPESPFNKHTSPVFMTLLCAGGTALTSWRFYNLDMNTGFIIYITLTLLVIVTSTGFAIYRKSKKR